MAVPQPKEEAFNYYKDTPKEAKRFDSLPEQTE
jgi:hypothetical protein